MTRVAKTSAPLDAARSKVPRWAARLMLGTLAACLRVPPPAWARSAVGPSGRNGRAQWGQVLTCYIPSC